DGIPLNLEKFQVAFLPLAGGVVVAIVLSFFLHETGSAAASGRRGTLPTRLPGAVAA
ncbi:MAG: hypothetical protein JWQ11_758, partial [Rhizobacter sp.]|nr:hypothetical protein [Rhizobacter sp.]